MASLVAQRTVVQVVVQAQTPTEATVVVARLVAQVAQV
jgi:hypothetical protein